MKTKLLTGQDELPFVKMAAHQIWEGRRTITVSEVAKELRCVVQHVFNLIETGRLGAIDISTGRPLSPGKRTIHRQAVRVPVEAWDAFIKDSSTL